MHSVLMADVLVSSGKGTSSTVGRIVVDARSQEPIPADVREHRNNVMALAHELACASSKGERKIATINLVNFWHDGVKLKMVPRVIAVYAAGNRLRLYELEAGMMDEGGLVPVAEREVREREAREREYQKARMQVITGGQD